MKAGLFFSMALVAAAACSKSNSDESNVGGHGADDPYTQAASYALDTIECQSDADCCVVFDGCHAAGYVVGVADRQTVAELLAQGSATAQDCLACMNPAIQVYCGANGYCVGEKVECFTEEPFYSQASQDHCDSLTVPEPCGGGAGGGTGGDGAGGVGGGGASGFQDLGGAAPYIIGCG